LPAAKPEKKYLWQDGSPASYRSAAEVAQSLSQWTRWLLTRGNLSYYISRVTYRGLLTGGKLSYSISK